jgi:ribonuclease H2 subunit A
MMKHPPTNLNQQSQEATVLLIQETLAKGIELTEVCISSNQKGYIDVTISVDYRCMLTP